jgi:hydroxyacylglutathione hydrolase
VPNITICGGEHDSVPGATKLLKDGDKLELGSLTITVMHTPCHTRGHVLYHVESSVADVENALFTGDTLFIAGCGRFFEGDAKQMYSALVERIGILEDSTLIYCGHEYTVKDLEFAESVEPDNEHITAHLKWAKSIVAQKKFTVPSCVGLEKLINPFLRVNEQVVRKFTNR